MGIEIAQFTLTTVPLSKIRPNPFRNMDRYPIVRKKIEALKASFSSTGWWGNIIGRQVDGNVEIAYGHHRWKALEELLSPQKHVSLLVGDISDPDMLRMMADENLEEWGHLFLVELETVRAVVEAYGRGEIELEKPHAMARGAQLRHAPSFVQGDTGRPGGAYPYTAVTLGGFLGWGKTRIKNCLLSAELIELGSLDEKDLRDLGARQARSVIEEASKERRRQLAQAKEKETAAARAKTDARKQDLLKKKEQLEEKAKESSAEIASKVADRIRSGEIGYAQADTEAHKHRAKKEKKLPNARQFTEKLATKISKILRDDGLGERLDLLAKHRDQLLVDGRAAARALQKALTSLSKRAEKYAAKFDLAPRRTVQTQELVKRS